MLLGGGLKLPRLDGEGLVWIPGLGSPTPTKLTASQGPLAAGAEPGGAWRGRGAELSWSIAACGDTGPREGRGQEFLGPNLEGCF